MRNQWQRIYRTCCLQEQIAFDGRLTLPALRLGCLLLPLQGLRLDLSLDQLEFGQLEFGQRADLDRSGAHSKPRSAIDKASPGATITWSSTRTSISASAVLSVCVRASSAREGCTVPLG